MPRSDLDLRLGDWRDVLADEECDVLITDTPYGERTHAGHNAGIDHSLAGNNGSSTYRSETTRRRKLSYKFWTPDDVRAFVEHWSPRTRGWFCAFSCSDLFPVWRAEFARAGRVAFAPVPCVIRAMSVRLCGDGPSNWAIYLNVARPVGQKFGTLPGAYVVTRAHQKNRIGGKPIALMNAITRDYTRPGDLVCDPCAGYATTLQSAVAMGRRGIGAEIDPDTHAEALDRLSAGQMELTL